MSKNQRFMELEGLRGIAALIVVVFHIVTMFFPRIIYGDYSEISVSHSKYEDLLFGSPISGLFSGLFAVSIFFVLSGFVLSIGFFQSGDSKIVKRLASKRYIRLMIPALASIIIAYFLIYFGIDIYRDQAAQIIGGGSMGIQWNFIPNIYEAIQQGTWSIFATGVDTYNRVLWTMHYEFFGSFLVFIFLLIFGKSPNRWIVYLILLVATFGSWYTGFLVGMLLADVYVNTKLFEKLKKLPVIATGMLIGGIVIGGYPILGASETFYSLFTLPWFTETQNTTIYLAVGAGLLIVSVLVIGKISRFLASPLLSRFGKFTFSIYLTHILVLLTFTSFLFVATLPHLGYTKSVIFSVLVSVPILVLVTVLFDKYIDQPSIRFSGYVANWIDGLSKTKNIYTERSRFVKIIKRMIFRD